MTAADTAAVQTVSPMAVARATWRCSGEALIGRVPTPDQVPATTRASEPAVLRHQVSGAAVAVGLLEGALEGAVVAAGDDAVPKSACWHDCLLAGSTTRGGRRCHKHVNQGCEPHDISGHRCGDVSDVTSDATCSAASRRLR